MSEVCQLTSADWYTWLPCTVGTNDRGVAINSKTIVAVDGNLCSWCNCVGAAMIADILLMINDWEEYL